MIFPHCSRWPPNRNLEPCGGWWIGSGRIGSYGIERGPEVVISSSQRRQRASRATQLDTVCSSLPKNRRLQSLSWGGARCVCVLCSISGLTREFNKRLDSKLTSLLWHFFYFSYGFLLLLPSWRHIACASAKVIAAFYTKTKANMSFGHWYAATTFDRERVRRRGVSERDGGREIEREGAKQNAYCQCEARIINCAYQYRRLCCFVSLFLYFSAWLHAYMAKSPGLRRWLLSWPPWPLAAAHWDKPVRLCDFLFGFSINHSPAKCYVSVFYAVNTNREKWNSFHGESY